MSRKVTFICGHTLTLHEHQEQEVTEEMLKEMSLNACPACTGGSSE